MDLPNITTPYPKHIQQKMDEDFAKLMKEIDDDKKQSAGKNNLKRRSNKNNTVERK
jgi:hypothetical protein